MRDAPGSDFHVALGKRLESLRKRLQFTPKEIGERVGVSAQSVRSYEIGTRRVPVNVLPVFAQVLGVRFDVLLGVTAAPSLPKLRASPAQLRHVDELRRLARRDRLAILRITRALARDGGDA